MIKRIARCVGLGLMIMTAAAVGRAADDKSAAKDRPANRLAKETSPYLLLHAHNPVDWYPWGPEALTRAKTENKPIFLSVGYSSCYWCHVMERESFVDPEIAKALNAGFVCIKVDREERPDVDQVYMAAVQAFGPGGWPMSLFLTPDGRPFFAGTYFPPRERQGSPGFLKLVTAVARAWADQRAEINKTADQATEIVRKRLKANSQRKLPLSRDSGAEGVKQLSEQFDAEHGGFGYDPANPRRPKFPQPVDLSFLLAQNRGGVRTNEASDPLKMVAMTLDRMARGGIRDHLDGGYHRYSTDRFWLVPHFEKMLYDNAQLASVHLAAFEITRDARWREDAEATFSFVERKLTAPEGGFYSALDAETKGEEGAYYVWTTDEVKRVLDGQADVDLFAEVYGLKGEPSFEGKRYVLHEPRSRGEQAKKFELTPDELEARLRPLRATLLAARDKRSAPLCDDKVLTGWNGLMIAAYADGYRVLKVEKYRRAAEKAAGFLLGTLRLPDGRLLRTYRSGQAKLPAYLEDYSFLAYGLLRLHAATAEARWLREARALVERMIADFEDRDEGGFFFTAAGHETLLARAKDASDNALPSSNGMAILDLMALYRATGEASYRDHAGKALGAFSTSLAQAPASMPVAVIALEQYLDSQTGKPAGNRFVPGTHDDATTPIVTATARLAARVPAEIAARQELEVIVAVSIQKGWHIYANPAGPAELKPTILSLERRSDGAVRLLGVSYPTGEPRVLGSLGAEKVALYEGTVEFRARLKLADDVKAGPLRVTLSVAYQACNDQLCQAPVQLKIPLAVTVGP